MDVGNPAETCARRGTWFGLKMILESLLRSSEYKPSNKGRKTGIKLVQGVYGNRRRLQNEEIVETCCGEGHIGSNSETAVFRKEWFQSGNSGQLHLQLNRPDKETSRVFTDTPVVEENTAAPSPLVEVEERAQ